MKEKPGMRTSENVAGDEVSKGFDVTWEMFWLCNVFVTSLSKVSDTLDLTHVKSDQKLFQISLASYQIIYLNGKYS